MRWRLFPWPSRSERRQNIEQARAGAATARREADRAGQIERDMRRIAYEENHWAARIAEQFTQHHRPQGG